VSIDPEDLKRSRRRAYDQTIQRMIPDLRAPVRAPHNGDRDNVADIVQTARLVAESANDGAHAREAVGEVTSPETVVADAVLRLYVPHIGVPMSTELFELVRATVGFTMGWCNNDRRVSN
jgi:hypothetical protein